jgi:ABC-type transport system involved in multi-copper enzyme maturation permease subunit
MEIALTTKKADLGNIGESLSSPLTWKAWQESQGRFFSGLGLLSTIVIYAVFSSPGFLARYNARFPTAPLSYSAYVWSGLFHYALQGLWIFAAVILCFGGLAREKANGVALFTLGLPVRRLYVFAVRALIACIQAVLLGLASSILISSLSPFVNRSYPLAQSLAFGSLMSAAGLVFVALGLLLSELFSGEFTAPVIGLCGFTALFFAYKGHLLYRWNLFDAMSAAGHVDPTNKLLYDFGFLPSTLLCLLLALGIFLVAGMVVRARDF